MRRLDLITGLVTAAVGALAFWDANDLAMFGENHVPGPGFFPKNPRRTACHPRPGPGRNITAGAQAG
jgi:hypothetical protein